jgi:hypothetical protein
VFVVLLAVEAGLFYYLKTMPRIDPRPSTDLLYSAPYYGNLALKTDHDLVFLADRAGELATSATGAVLSLLPVMVFTVAWLLFRRPDAEH